MEKSLVLHSLRVGYFTSIICDKLNIIEKDRIIRASLNHDIGKTKLDQSILKKAQPLTDSEMEHIKLHPLLSHSILSKHGLVKEAIIACQHHENFDGTGYMGLRGKNIELGSRVIRVADVFDALTSERVYKKAFSVEKTINIMNVERGIYDPLILDTFINEVNKTNT